MSRTTTKIIIAQQDGTVVGQYFLGQGEHLIGREDHCTIQLEADQVSREHARLIISADAIEIEDLDSTSGTFVDGIAVKGRIPIQPGQKLWISDLYIDIERQGFGGLIEGSRLGNGRFTLKRELGKGGMGAVWLALDEDVHENVALKLVSDGVTMDPKGLKDLQREVNKSHKLVHPNIVRMGYFWKEEGEPAFISLEYVDGTDLHQIRSQSPKGLLAWEEVQRYMIQLCDALEYAHSQKVAHRDIKPSNFMITSEGNLKLADFGIAATLADTVNTLTSNTVLGSGTPSYMSPQQMDGDRPHVTDDIYSVGATFYELLTSKPPFYRGDIGHQIRHAEVTPMVERLKELELANDIPKYVSAIVMACLQKDPAQRPQSTRVIREWIQSGAEVGAPVTARETQVLKVAPATATTKKVPASGNRKKWAYGIATAVFTAIIVIAVNLVFKKKPLDQAGLGESIHSITLIDDQGEKMSRERQVELTDEGIWQIQGGNEPYTGKMTAHHESGAKRYEMELKGGKPDGLETWWDEAGMMRMQIAWQEGEKNGKWIIWDASKKINYEASWSQGNLLAENSFIIPSEAQPKTNPNPESLGRKRIWTLSKDGLSIDVAYRSKSSDIILKAFGEPDEKIGNTWVYRGMKVLPRGTSMGVLPGVMKSVVWFRMSDGKVRSVEAF